MPDQDVPDRSTTAPTPTPGQVCLDSDCARQCVEDALLLTGYAVSSGYKNASGEILAAADLEKIQTVAAKLGVFGARTADTRASVSIAEWIGFEQAYYRIAVAMAPITAETLRSTAALASAGDAGLFDRFRGYSPAVRFTRMFSAIAFALAAFVVAAEVLIFVWGQEADTRIWLWQRNLLQTLQPWAYGALGSCAYLLRSAHTYIYSRSFDLRRKPEYFNRILLGGISGGSIILFVNYLTDENGNVLNLGSAALGFIAGYSTDFLFNTIERVIAAVFPKTDSDPIVQPSRSLQPKSQPLRDLRPPSGQPDGANIKDGTGQDGQADSSGGDDSSEDGSAAVEAPAATKPGAPPAKPKKDT